MTLERLQGYPQLYPQVAGWIFEAFRYGFEGDTFEDWLELLTQGQQDGSMITFVALEGDQPVATASLDVLDFPPKDHLSPWLASVYTRPEFRGRGIGRQIVARVEAEAQMRGFSRLYLHTTDRVSFYLKQGWIELDQMVYWGQAVTLMCKDL